MSGKGQNDMFVIWEIFYAILAHFTAVINDLKIVSKDIFVSKKYNFLLLATGHPSILQKFALGIEYICIQFTCNIRSLQTKFCHVTSSLYLYVCVLIIIIHLMHFSISLVYVEEWFFGKGKYKILWM